MIPIDVSEVFDRVVLSILLFEVEPVLELAALIDALQSNVLQSE